MPDVSKMNLNYLLNNEYYKYPISEHNFGTCNNQLLNRTYTKGGKVRKIFAECDEVHIPLKTSYPGLLIGIGNMHAAGVDVQESQNDEVEIKLGFTLDYVTGLPVIPASTVKGVLRSAFKYNNACVAEYALQQAEVNGIGKEDIDKLRKEIFGTDSDDKEDKKGSVIFLDAIPVKGGKDGKLFGLDNITPHGDEFKNPVPLSMLKVIPGVVFLFRFVFREKEMSIDKATLSNVFKAILSTLGIGAKTNVGYGAMEELNEEDEYHYLKYQVNHEQ